MTGPDASPVDDSDEPVPGEFGDPLTDGLDEPLYVPRCTHCGQPLLGGDPDAAGGGSCRCRTGAD